MTLSARRLGAAFAVAMALAAFGAGVDAQRRSFGAAPAVAPLLAGPPARTAWRLPRRYGLELPIAVDARLLAAGLGDRYRVILPRVSRQMQNVELVVEDVRADAANIPSPAIAGVRGPVSTGGLVYTGTVAGGAGAVAVLSVISDVLYGRFVFDEDVWVVFSDARGRTYVRLEQRPPAADAPAAGARFPDRMVPSSQRRRRP